jgi:hypothetical protein
MPTATTTQHNLQRYVLIHFDERYLFVPQTDVHAVEIIADAHLTRTTMGSVGWFGHGSESPLFCLDKALNLLVEVPESREYFVLLKSAEQPVGLIGDEVENINLQHEHLHRQKLPVVMKTTYSPISQLVIYQNQLACVCQGADLVHYLTQLSKQFMQSRH